MSSILFRLSDERLDKKKKRKSINCNGCGAVVKKKKCEYCGTPYPTSKKEN